MFTADYRWSSPIILSAVLGMLASRAVMVVACCAGVNCLPSWCSCSWRLVKRGGREGRSGEREEGGGGRESDGGDGGDSMNGKGSVMHVPAKTQFILWFAGLRGGERGNRENPCVSFLPPSSFFFAPLSPSNLQNVSNAFSTAPQTQA